MIVFLIGGVLGLLPAAIAASKGRNFFLWWIYGALLFIIALPHSFFPSRNLGEIERRRLDAEPVMKCPSCAEVIKADAKVCRYCNREVTPLVAIAS